MSAPLNNEQKRILSQLAQRAFQRECALARGRGESPAINSAAADAFRRREVIRATGKAGLRLCSQNDYGAVKGHFLNLLNRPAEAFQAVHRGEGNGRRVAEFKLVQACEQTGVRLDYAAAICRTQFKCTLEDATEKQIWCLVYTVRNRRKSKTPQPA